jgi:hypothetical protein
MKKMWHWVFIAFLLPFVVGCSALPETSTTVYTSRRVYVDPPQTYYVPPVTPYIAPYYGRSYQGNPPVIDTRHFCTCADKVTFFQYCRGIRPYCPAPQYVAPYRRYEPPRHYSAPQYRYYQPPTPYVAPRQHYHRERQKRRDEHRVTPTKPPTAQSAPKARQYHERQRRENDKK